MRAMLKLLMILATLLLVGINVLQCAGIGSAFGAAADASKKQAALVTAMKADLEGAIRSRGLVRRLERVPVIDESGHDWDRRDDVRLVWAKADGAIDYDATALNDRIDRESLLSTGATVATGLGGILGVAISGGLLCVSVAIWGVVMLVVGVILAVTRKPKVV